MAARRYEGEPRRRPLLNHDEALAFDVLSQGVELSLHTLFSSPLFGVDKGTAHVAVLHEPLTVRNTTCQCIAFGGGHTRVRHAHYHVGFNRYLLR